MIRMKRRGRTWWLDINHNGERQRYSLKTRDREIADELRRQKELEILSGGKLADRTWRIFRDEFTGWAEPHLRPSTMKRYRETLARFSDFLAAERISKLDQISHPTISKYCTARAAPRGPGEKRRPLTPGGLRFELRILRRVFSYAVRCRYIAVNPVAGFGNLQAEAGKTQSFSSSEINAMLDAAKNDKRMTAILNVFLHTGLRLGDVIALEKTAVRDERWEVKTRKRHRWVQPLVHPDLRRALDTWGAAQNEKQIASDFLFTTEAGGPMRYMDQELRRLWKRAGVTHGHAHRFRDTFATRMLELGWTLFDVARSMGIGEDVVARHYAPHTPQQQQRQDEMIRSLNFNLQRRLPTIQ